MDISAILNNDNGATGLSSIPTDITNDGTSGNQSDPLMSFDDNGPKLAFNANDTINTNDNSAVGEYNAVQAAEPIPQDTPVDMPAEFEITDPAKMDFIKTYTKEYDDLVAGTTHAVELILKSIDKTVTEHSSDIDIPEEAMPYLTNKPENNKVQKFDEAQEIVRIVMNKASEAKTQAEQAAIEAAQIYDGIQQFKHDTEMQIDDIRNRDEFGRSKK